MKHAVALTVTLLFGGCAATGTQLSQTAAMQFKEGVTTEAQIISKLGNPTGASVASGGIKTLVYAGSQYQIKSASFIPIIGLFSGGSDYSVSTAAYEIDQQGVMQKATYSSQAGSSRNGSAPAVVAPTEPVAIR